MVDKRLKEYFKEKRKLDAEKHKLEIRLGQLKLSRWALDFDVKDIPRFIDYGNVTGTKLKRGMLIYDPYNEKIAEFLKNFSRIIK